MTHGEAGLAIGNPALADNTRTARRNSYATISKGLWRWLKAMAAIHQARDADIDIILPVAVRESAPLPPVRRRASATWVSSQLVDEDTGLMGCL